MILNFFYKQIISIGYLFWFQIVRMLPAARLLSAH